MTTIPLQFASQAYQLRSVQFAAQRCVNLMPEMGPVNGKTPIGMAGIPSLLEFTEIGNGPIRGLIQLGVYAIVVSGSEVYRLSANQDSLLLGQVTAGRQIVKMASNGTQVLILAGAGVSDGFIATTEDVTQITDPDFLGGSDVDFLDGYFIISVPDSDEYYISALYDGFVYDPLDFATAEGAPDNIRGLIVDHREIWLMGDETIEVWYNSGNPDFPFERASGTFIQRGTSARDSLVRLDNSLFWVGEDGIVYRAQGYNPVRISTDAIEQRITESVSASDLIAFGYSLDGHAVYVLKKPEEWTLVYDAQTKLWHERQSCGRGFYKVDTFLKIFDRYLLGDDRTGKIYFLDNSVFGRETSSTSSDVEGTCAIMAAPPLWADAQTASVNALVVDMQRAVGLTTGQGSDPKVMLRYSNDGGHTWSSEKWRNMGKKGEYKSRARWNRHGNFRQRVYELTIADPVQRFIMEAYAEVEGGRL